MKNPALFTALLVLGIANLTPARAGDVLETRHGAGSGKSYRDISSFYIARTPYKLEWHADEKYAIAGSRDPAWKGKDDSSCVHVYDEAGNIVAKSGWTGLRGSINVPVGGRHRVRVFSLGQWSANIIENQEVLKQAQRDGYLTETSIINPAARAASPAGRRESVANLLAADLATLEKKRAAIASDDPARQTKLNELDELAATAKMAASRSSGVGDYLSRLKSLTPTASASAPSPEIPAADETVIVDSPTSATEASAWDGKGLPPGMTKQ